jgi:hypothetical protein
MDIKETITRQVGNDIITCTDERATTIVSSIVENNAKGIDLYFSNCELIKELRDTSGYYLLGYSSFKDFAEEVFDSGYTQAKNMCLIAKYFGKENDDKTWTIIDKDLLKVFTATQLLYIGQLKGYDGNITEAVTKYGFTFTEDNKKCTTTTAQLRELVQYEKSHKKFLSLSDVETIKNQLPTPTKEGEQNVEETNTEEAPETNTEEAPETTSTNKVDTVSKADFERSQKKADGYLERLIEIEKIVNDSKLTDKKVRELLKSAFKNMKEVNNQ